MNVTTRSAHALFRARGSRPMVRTDQAEDRPVAEPVCDGFSIVGRDSA